MDASTELAVLDTNVWSSLYGVKSRPHPDRAAWEVALLGRTVVIPVQVRAEVLVWVLSILGGNRRDTVLTALDRTPTIPIDEQIIQRYARLTIEARARGDALGQKEHIGDRWVAATALAIGAPLLTADRIFDSDPDLVLLGRSDDPGSSG